MDENLSFLVRLNNGRSDGNCIIGPDIHEELMRREKIIPSRDNNMNQRTDRISSRKNDLAILSSLPPDKAKMMLNSLNSRNKVLGEPEISEEELQDYLLNVKNNYITVICRDEIDPKYNRLQLRTDPPSFIELQSGKNLLHVSQYPDLRYGFKQIDEIPDDQYVEGISCLGEENCQDVIEIDLSHFDGSEMTSMEDMFYWIQNLKKVNFDNLDTSKVSNMSYMFRCCEMEEVDLSKLDTSNVTDMSGMFSLSVLKKINLSGIDTSHVTSTEDMFMGTDELKELCLFGCSKETITTLAEEVSFYSIGETQRFDNVIVLDNNLKLSYDTYSGKVNLLEVDASGKKLLKVIPNDTQIISVPKGITIIGKEAFEGCDTVRFINLPDGLLKIEDKAFSGCVNLLSIDFPKSLKEVGNAVFKGCDNLRFVAFENNLCNVKDGFLDKSNVERLVLPITVGSKIGDFTFIGAVNLRELEIFATDYSKIEYQGLFDDILHSIQAVDANDLQMFPYTVFNVADSNQQSAYTKNGMLIELKDIPDDDDTVSCLTCMHPAVTIIPRGIEGIASYFSIGTHMPGMSRPEGLGCYIPEKSLFPNFLKVPDSVRYIEDYAFFSNTDIEYILTPNDNVENLRSLLSETSMSDCEILGI